MKVNFIKHGNLIENLKLKAIREIKKVRKRYLRHGYADLLM
jgi:hypothetical protein